MKSKSFLCIASLAVALAIPVSAQAQVQSDSHSRYRVIRLSGLGGAYHQQSRLDDGQFRPRGRRNHPRNPVAARKA